MKQKNGFLEKINQFKEEHPDIYEFIMFNLLSNVATITKFAIVFVPL